jgi:hypothetical protein
LIKAIDKINSVFYFLIENFHKTKPFTTNVALEEKLIEFFIISSLSSEYSLVNIPNVLNKCIHLKNNDEYFISICHSEEDHD